MSAPLECKLKKKCAVINSPTELLPCWVPDCQNWMHEECCNAFLNHHGIELVDRPNIDDCSDNVIDGETTAVVFCTKGCHEKWRTQKNKEVRAAAAAAKELARLEKKRKVPWEEDGSLEVLMDWLTTEGNCASYCGSSGNKGRTKAVFHKEIAKLIKEKKPETDRSDKDVENEIGKLERQFREAHDWTQNTGVGVNNPGEFQLAVKKRCPLFCELEDIMGSRPNAKPMSTNENDFPIVESEDESVGSFGHGDAEAIRQISNNNTQTPERNSDATSVSAKNTAAKRLTSSQAGGQPKKGKDTKTDEIVSNFFDGDEHKQWRLREVEAKEKEASARMMEAAAVQDKANEEKKVLQVQFGASLLRERHKLMLEGVAQDDIDEMLPMPK